MPDAGQVGNGGHLHASAWSGTANVLAGGDGPYGGCDGNFPVGFEPGDAGGELGGSFHWHCSIKPG